MENTLVLDNRMDTGSSEHSSGVSWGAVVVGAFVAASVSLIMLALGAGFGLGVVSPWSNTGASSSALGIAAICWLIAMQMVSCVRNGSPCTRMKCFFETRRTDFLFGQWDSSLQ